MASGSRSFAVLFVTTYLVVQIAVPLRGLLDADQSRFAWEMFSRLEEWPEYVVVLEDDRREPVRIGHYVWQIRGLKEAHATFEKVMPDHLCGAISHAASVVASGRVHRCE